MRKASLETTKRWNELPWAKIQRKTFKLQKRIFQAVKSGQKAKARKLQKLLLKSYYAKLLAVRRVSQDNQGKKTAGVDGIKVVYGYQRILLAQQLVIKGYKSKALRRVWIPKPGRDEKRPLGIPTIKDRAMQALIKSALEPYWEAQFEGTSYGFRPGRSAHDAIERIFRCTNNSTKYVLDADITKCFDKINHDYLLSKLECPSNIRFLVKQWLKAGVMDNGVFEETDSGTPQGGVISPLLANIALDGMIRDTVNKFPKSIKRNRKQIENYRPRIIRYADDFLVLHNELEVILQCKTFISQWLGKVGLTLKPEKTRICHTLNEIDVDGNTSKPGFDFLGFNIRTYPVGKHHSSRSTNRTLLGFKTIIKPSEKAIKAHNEAIKETIMLRAWTVSRTGKANYEKLSKYFSHGKNGKWTFQTRKKEGGSRLLKHQETPIIRHKLVRPEASPYDGNWTYWSKRRGKYPETPSRVAKLMKKQKGKCNLCRQHFSSEDVVEVDHIIPKSKGGKDEWKNLQLLHRHCHDIKTKDDGSHEKSVDNDMVIPENYRWIDDVLIVPMTWG